MHQDGMGSSRSRAGPAPGPGRGGLPVLGFAGQACRGRSRGGASGYIRKSRLSFCAIDRSARIIQAHFYIAHRSWQTSSKSNRGPRG